MFHYPTIGFRFQFCFVFHIEEGYSAVTKELRRQYSMGGNTDIISLSLCFCTVAKIVSFLQFI